MKKIAFTITLNGKNFLEKQHKIIPEVFDKWYIIEGPVKSVNCTSWCKDIPQEYMNDINMSSDGTYEYLNSIASDKIEIIRPPIVDGKHRYWNGKVEMCNSFMDKVENSVLMQVDNDEFWSKQVLNQMFEWCETVKDTASLQFRCNFFVGENLILTGTNNYGDMPYEWNRLWVIKEKTTWKSHEPPVLTSKTNLNYNKDFTFQRDWGFRHYAYLTEEQVRFKEVYYGYKGAVDAWKKLQNETEFPVYLRDYFPWVKDNAQVVKIGE